MGRVVCVLLLTLSLLAPASAATYVVVNTVTAIGGSQVTVANPAAPVSSAAVQGLDAILTLQNPTDRVSCLWSMPVQTNGPGSAVLAQLTRGGVPIGLPQVVYSSNGALLVSVGGLATDAPGYIGPLDYNVTVSAWIGSGHAPGNNPGAGTITCDDIVVTP